MDDKDIFERILSVELYDGSREELCEIVCQITHFFAWSWMSSAKDDGSFDSILFFDDGKKEMFENIPDGVSDQNIDEYLESITTLKIDVGDLIVVYDVGSGYEIAILESDKVPDDCWDCEKREDCEQFAEWEDRNAKQGQDKKAKSIKKGHYGE